MAYDYYIDKEINCVFARHVGDMVRGEIELQLDEMFANSDFEPGLNIFRDMRDANLPDYLKYKNFIKWAPNNIPRIDRNLGICKIAWVVLPGDGYIKTHQMRLAHRFDDSPVQRHEFIDLIEARNWLDIPPEYEIKTTK